MTTHDEDKIIAQQARIEQLTNFIEHAQVSSGICCCGDSMEGHPSPMTCGHSPVDMWDYHYGKLLEAYPDDLSALRAHDEKLLAPYQWQPIETAPKVGAHLAYTKGNNRNQRPYVIVWLDADHPDADGAGWYEHWNFDPVEPTHWMPLPSTEAIEKGGV